MKKEEHPKHAMQLLIRFHQNGLAEHRYQMSPSAITLTETTIEHLQEKYDAMPEDK